MLLRPGLRASRLAAGPRRGGAAGGGIRPRARRFGEAPRRALEAEIDRWTVELHRKYHDKTIEYTMGNMEWVESKAYSTDRTLTFEQQVQVKRAARERLWRWPRLEDRDLHDVQLGSPPQRFCASSDGCSCAASLGDPEENVFVISLPRRPSKLRHALCELHSQGVSAKIVDAIDGDTIFCKQDLERHAVEAMPGYSGHANHKINLTTGEVGCFMSHCAVWHHMVEKGHEAALILEDDFDFQEHFAERLGRGLQEASAEDWNLLYVGRSPAEPDVRTVSEHVVQPGYTLWTVGYVIRLEAARRLVDGAVHSALVPLDEYFSIAMGQHSGVYNEFAHEWATHIPRVFRGLALTPPLVMPYVGSMFLSDTAMVRKGTRYVKDLPWAITPEEEETEFNLG